MSEDTEQNYVEIYNESGQIIKCEVFDIIDFEDKTYTLLLPLDEESDDSSAEVIVMEYIEDGDDCYFQNIEDENEFKRVCEYIESLEEEGE